MQGKRTTLAKVVTTLAVERAERLAWWARAALILAILGGCDQQASTPSGSTSDAPRPNESAGQTASPGQTKSTRSVLPSARDGDAVLLDNAAAALNTLPEGVVLDLAPPQPVLTAANSADGQEVRAACIVNPQTPDSGEFNYLLVTEGNANFAASGVRAGDMVRYYVNVDEESLGEGMIQRKAIELTVRRLSDRDPQNALILEVGLQAAVLEPQRIEIWRYSDKRMNAIRKRLEAYATYRTPPTGWEPTPDEVELEQITDRINRWYLNQPVDAAWQEPALLSDLPEPIRSIPGVAEFLAPSALSRDAFAPWEGRMLQQAIWCRDIAEWAKGKAFDDSEVIPALFDWTVRNVWLTKGDRAVGVFHPWQALLYGRGNGADRAWVFVELCRHQRIDACVLTLGKEADARPSRLLAAALCEGELLLFDPVLGLPIPSDDGDGVASLQQIVDAPSLLRQLDVKEGDVYPLQAEDLAYVKAWVVASPTQVARRSEITEYALEGDRFVTLTSDVDALFERLGKLPGISAVGLWTYPWQSAADQYDVKISQRTRAVAQFWPFAQRPQLWKARVLHFQGDKPVPTDQRDNPLAHPLEGHLDALALYQDRLVRPGDRILARLPEEKRAVYAAAKRDAAYWIGLLCYDREDYSSGKLWLDQLLLKPDPNGPRASGARYNLARCCEALGDLERAVQLLRSDDASSAQRHGNLVRAQRLAKRASTEPDAPADDSKRDEARGDEAGERVE